MDIAVTFPNRNQHKQAQSLAAKGEKKNLEERAETAFLIERIWIKNPTPL